MSGYSLFITQNLISSANLFSTNNYLFYNGYFGIEVTNMKINSRTAINAAILSYQLANDQTLRKQIEASLRRQKPYLNGTRPTELAAQYYHISQNSVTNARNVLNDGCPTLNELAFQNRISMTRASFISKMSAEDQEVMLATA